MQEQARFFKALADETHLQILWLPLAEEELCVCDIMRALDITRRMAAGVSRQPEPWGLLQAGGCGPDLHEPTPWIEKFFWASYTYLND